MYMLVDAINSCYAMAIFWLIRNMAVDQKLGRSKEMNCDALED